MVNHDYKCPGCGVILRDHKVSIQVGAKAGAPDCPRGCEQSHATLPVSLGPMRMAWIPQVQWMDALEPFQEFYTTDTYGKRVLVESTRKLRQIEDESRRECASNDGTAQLLNWRDKSQDQSNADVCSIAARPDRSLDDQDSTLEVDPRFGSGAMTEASAEQAAGDDVAWSAGDVLGDG